MTSAYGPDGPENHATTQNPLPSRHTIECQLFESLVHHLVEKGVLTRNDALSVVQTVAEVKRGEQVEGRSPAEVTDGELGALGRLYSSFELLQDQPFTSHIADSQNIFQLRPPLHDDGPQFPRDD